MSESGTSAPPGSRGSTTCPLCHGTGWRRTDSGLAPGSATVARCDCQQHLRQSNLLEQARIPPRYDHCTFENFDLDLPMGAEQIRWAHRWAATYAAEFPGGIDSICNGLLFTGPVGVGKTHLAVAVAHQLIERGIECRFCDYRDLLKRIQATFDPANPATENSVVVPLLRAQVLILDDLGVGRTTEWAAETLHYILNDRYSNNAATIITTNLPEAEATAAAGSELRLSLAQVVGERLRSRLWEMCRAIPLAGRDFRRESHARGLR